MFADDVLIYTIDDCALLQSALSSLSSYASSNSLAISLAKSVIVQFGPHPPCSFHLSSGPLSTVSEVKYLGVTISSNLSYSKHIESMVTKATAVANCLLRAFRSKNPQLLAKLFKIYCRPIVEYASVVWSPYKVHESDQIERLQRVFTRRAFVRSGARPEYADRLQLADLSLLSTRRLHADLLQTFKILRHFSSLSPSPHFTLSSRNHNSRTHNFKLTRNIARSSTYHNFFYNRVCSH